jgi:hypothetical protein
MKNSLSNSVEKKKGKRDLGSLIGFFHGFDYFVFVAQTMSNDLFGHSTSGDFDASAKDDFFRVVDFID